VQHFIEDCNGRLASQVGKIGELTRRERLHVVCKARLKMLLPVESSWSDALAVLALPYNFPCRRSLLVLCSAELLFPFISGHPTAR
jgi:ubiquinone biosynthesis protein COQ9